MLRRAAINSPASALRSLVSPSTRSFHATVIARDPPNKPTAAESAAATAAAEAKDEGAAPSASGRSLLGSIIYGSESAKAEGDVRLPPGQHSKIVGRGKYMHEKITHAVKPGHRDAYIKACEEYFATLMRDSKELGGVKLCGSWETIIGSVGNFVHILEHDGYAGYDETRRQSLKNETLQAHLNAMLPHLESRQHQMVSEFSFWPSSPPKDHGAPDGGIYELRTYQLRPGKLLEWETAWRRGIEARRRYVEPVGAFFSQVGQLHEVHHIWFYPDMSTRKQLREAAWSVSGWGETVQQTVSLTDSMKTTIMVPCSWSPLH